MIVSGGQPKLRKLEESSTLKVNVRMKLPSRPMNLVDLNNAQRWPRGCLEYVFYLSNKHAWVNQVKIRALQPEIFTS